MPDDTTSPPPTLLMLHKPKGYLVTRSDDRGRKTVYDLLPEWAFRDRWMPAGRLDRDSRGLLLFGRDGRVLEALTRPGRSLKTYEVWVRGRITDEHVAQALAGVETAVGPCRARAVEVRGRAGPKTRLRVVLDEGRNRHIRRLFSALRDPRFGTSMKVLEIKRTGVGDLSLDVASGKWRLLTPEEVARLVHPQPAASPPRG